MSWEEPGENSDTAQLASAASKKQDATSRELYSRPSGSAGTGSYKKAKEMMYGQRHGT